MSCEPGGVAIRAMCGDIAVALIPSPPPLAAVWEVPARRFRRRVGALVVVRPPPGWRQGTVLPNSSGSLAKMAAIRRASSLINRALTARPSNPASQIETVKNFRPWYSPHRGDAGLSRHMRPLCDMPLFYDQQWHDRAAEMRALAERMSNINTQAHHA